MRFAAGAVLLAAAFVRAEEASTVESESTSTLVVKPTFTVSHWSLMQNVFDLLTPTVTAHYAESSLP